MVRWSPRSLTARWSRRLLATRMAPLTRWLLIFVVCCGASASGLAQPPDLSAEEVDRILSIGAWPAADVQRRDPSRRDPTNRVSGEHRAIVFGEQLFKAPQLSINQAIACESCHRAQLGFSDGLVRSQGLARHDRNSQSLWNLATQRWFGWDGGADSLWAASIRPMLNANEMGATPDHIRRQIVGRSDWRAQYESLFGPMQADAAPTSDEVLANVGKAIAAYLETLVSAPTAFDRFRDALAGNDAAGVAAYPAPAKRGLKIFIGRGNCTVCHVGANFSNGEFHDVAIPFLIEPGRVDPGRHAGIRRVKSDRFNLLGRFNDQSSAAAGQADGKAASTAMRAANDGANDRTNTRVASLPAAIKTQTVQSAHRNWGEWKTPSLRNLKQTAPYMHNGSLATLHDVVRHYSDINQERLHSDGEQLLKPLKLSESEVDDLVAFLLTLSH